ncbi:MAG TPA: DUF4251 domain-containing protein [Chitinophagaceae bacterium]|nr:DUF4251 domain-containing protein [Chitinophagaceae bacterium]
MKTINKFLVGVLFAFFPSLIFAQNKEAEIKNSIQAEEFIFHAQTALPTSGSSRQLTSEYDLKVSKNSVVSHLPYFGRAYSVPYGSADGGLNFTSSKFSYTSKNRKKGGWEITIKPTDVTDFREFSLIISENGYGTLQALTNNRQPISFTGYVTSIK